MNIAAFPQENMAKMTSPIPRMRLNTPSFPGQDLVNKFIAATPSYMYSPIAGQHTFYFSELLRSLSQAKKAELMNVSRESTAHQQQSQILQANRKIGRKRGWNQLRNEDVDYISAISNDTERPLELTSKHPTVLQRCSSPDKKSGNSNVGIQVKTSRVDERKRDLKSASPEVEVSDTPPAPASVPSVSGDVLPQVTPAWYPSLYPHYGLDPANFFVDLRVSGHIFERKRELAAQALKTVANINNNNNGITSYFDNDFPKRSGSAFSIPKPREMEKNFENVINLSANDNRCSPSQDTVDEKDVKGSSYVMHVDFEGKSKKVFDNGITVYNVDDSDDNTSICKKQEESNSESDEDENIRVDIN
ncbi:uncharacterized protein LOC134826915 [Culicoides brevitarsis]|uniref:uncharacterized protein LOC134826915 n=1 Tax=Culicoides brevitarsis TaxID=469753 RepID=UPI00307CC753